MANDSKWADVKVGDGVTLNYYSDREAYTVIARTAKTLTIQRDVAKLDPNFKPVFIPGGFAGTVINQHEQTYAYERNENGSILKCYWSERGQRFFYNGCIGVSKGRHEFYDYNF